MKIAFDLDGTLWSYQRIFRGMQALLQRSGHQVGILTTHGIDARGNDIELLKKRKFPAFDFFICKTKKNTMTAENDTAWKVRMLAENNIDLLFDDCDDGSEEMFQELLDTGKTVIIQPRYPLTKHFN